MDLPDMATKDIHLSFLFFQAPPGGALRVASSSGDRVPTSPSPDGTKGTDDKDYPGPRVDTSEENGSRIDTSDEEASRVDTSDSHGEPEPQQAMAKAAAKAKAAGRRAMYSLQFLGTPVCVKAAMDFVGVGQGRLDRLKAGRLDGRRLRRMREATTDQRRSVWNFFWRLYHSVAEGMPDRFSFAAKDHH